MSNTRIPASRSKNRPDIHFSQSIDLNREQLRTSVNIGLKKVSDQTSNTGEQPSLTNEPSSSMMESFKNETDVDYRDNPAKQNFYGRNVHNQMVFESPQSSANAAVVINQHRVRNTSRDRSADINEGQANQLMAQYKNVFATPQALPTQKKMKPASHMISNSESKTSLGSQERKQFVARKLPPRSGVKTAAGGTQVKSTTSKMNTMQASPNPIKNGVYFNPSTQPLLLMGDANGKQRKSSNNQKDKLQTDRTKPHQKQQTVTIRNKRDVSGNQSSSSTGSIQLMPQKFINGIRSNSKPNDRHDSSDSQNSQSQTRGARRGMQFGALSKHLTNKRQSSLGDKAGNAVRQQTQNDLIDSNFTQKLAKAKAGERTQSQQGYRMKSTRQEITKFTLEGNRPGIDLDLNNTQVQSTDLSPTAGYNPIPKHLQTSQEWFNRAKQDHYNRSGRPDTHRTTKSFTQSNMDSFANHGNQIKRVRNDWDGAIEEEGFWEDRKRDEQSGDRQIMRSSGIKAETHTVLEKQMEIFRNLKNKRGTGQRMGSQDVRALDVTSDYNMAEDIVQPMGEVVQTFAPDEDDDSDDEFVMPGDEEEDNIAIFNEARKIQQKQGQRPPVHSNRQNDGEDRFRGQAPVPEQDEPGHPQFDYNRDLSEFDPTSQGIREDESDEEEEKQDNSQLRVTNYDDWLDLQESKYQQKQQSATQEDFHPHSNADLKRVVSKQDNSISMLSIAAKQDNYFRSPQIPTGRKASELTAGVGAYNHTERNKQILATKSSLGAQTSDAGRIDYQVDQIPYDQSNDGISRQFMASIPREREGNPQMDRPPTAFLPPIPVTPQKTDNQGGKAGTIRDRSRQRGGQPDTAERQQEFLPCASPQRSAQQILKGAEQDGIQAANPLPSFTRVTDASPKRTLTKLAEAIPQRNLAKIADASRSRLQDLSSASIPQSESKKSYRRPIQYLRSQIQNEEKEKDRASLIVSPGRNRNPKLDQLENPNHLTNTIEPPSSTDHLPSNFNSDQHTLDVSSSAQHQPITTPQKVKLRKNSITRLDSKERTPSHSTMQTLDNNPNLGQVRAGPIGSMTAPQSLNKLNTITQASSSEPNLEQDTTNDGTQQPQQQQRSSSLSKTQTLRSDSENTRQAAQQKAKLVNPNRLYNQETVSSKLKREAKIAFEAKKPPTTGRPPRKKKQVLLSNTPGLVDEQSEDEQEQQQPWNPSEPNDNDEPSHDDLPLGASLKYLVMEEPLTHDQPEELPLEEHQSLEPLALSLPNCPLRKIDRLIHKPRAESPMGFPERLDRTLKMSADTFRNLYECPSSATNLTYKGQELEAMIEHEDKVSNGCQAEFQEFTEESKEEPVSDEEADLYERQPGMKPNMCDSGIQTSAMHFDKIAADPRFQNKQIDKEYSTDWELSSIYDELQFKNQANKNNLFAATQEDCGQQVEEKQITQETSVQILSQIECEYNAEMLKRKQQSQNYAERTFELYVLGLNTLQALMYMLRLQKEWDTVTRAQYELDLNMDGSFRTLNLQVSSDQCIKLLTRCKKMYEAKSLILRLLKMTMDKDRLVTQVKKNQFESASEQKDLLSQVRRLGARITSQVNTLQEEHRILRRPFIVRGKDYLGMISTEMEELESGFNKGYFVDDTGTAGGQYPPTSNL